MPKKRKKKKKHNSNGWFNHNSKKKTKPFFKVKRTFGQRASDWLTQFAGSWTFIIGFLCFLFAWAALNMIVLKYRWDPYPFILLNLVLSCLAAIQAPIILMSQNRQAQRDRLDAKYDYQVNRKAEREIQDIQRDLEQIKNMIVKHHNKIRTKRK